MKTKQKKRIINATYIQLNSAELDLYLAFRFSLTWIKKVKVKCLHLNWITLSAIWAVLPRGPVRATTPLVSSVTTGGNRSTRRKPAMLGRVKLDNSLVTCDQGNNQITAWSLNRTLVTVVRDACTTTVPPVYISQVSCRYFCVGLEFHSTC